MKSIVFTVFILHIDTVFRLPVNRLTKLPKPFASASVIIFADTSVWIICNRTIAIHVTVNARKWRFIILFCSTRFHNGICFNSLKCMWTLYSIFNSIAAAKCIIQSVWHNIRTDVDSIIFRMKSQKIHARFEYDAVIYWSLPFDFEILLCDRCFFFLLMPFFIQHVHTYPNSLQFDMSESLCIRVTKFSVIRNYHCSLSNTQYIFGNK